jgi:hypothetical protein
MSEVDLSFDEKVRLTGVPLKTFALDLAQDTLLQLEGSNLEDIFPGEASLVASDQATLRVTHAEHASTEFDDFESSELSDVARSGDEDFGLGIGEGNTTRGEAWVQVGDHLLAIVDQAVSSGFGASVGPSPGWTFAGEDTNPFVAEFLVGSEHETNFATSGTLLVKRSLAHVGDVQMVIWTYNITGGHISVCTNVAGELLHESIAESANLIVGFALGIKVATTLGASHVNPRESVLEDLLEPEELENG